ncbi:MAG: hypothetical protein GQ550_06700 [Gammaproteobacteria bacterium]|nr:hypothetical protein [Gammaproteobacteria bacterium]
MNDSLKKPLQIIVVLVGIILTLVVIRTTYYYVYHTLPPQQVNISVSYLPENTCRMDSPIYMLITNDSGREIINTTFSLLIKKKTNNDIFIRLLEKNYSTDKIIKAGDSYGGCWTFPKLNTNFYAPVELIYEVSRKQIVFKD